MKTKLFCLPLLTVLLTSTAFSVTLIGNTGVDEAQVSTQHSDERGIVMDFRIPAISVRTVQKGEEEFDLLYLESEGITGRLGYPELPTITRLFAIPNQASVRIISIQPQYVRVNGLNPYPHQTHEIDSPHNPDEWIFDDDSYGNGGFYPERWVEIGEPVIMRDFRILPVTVFPVRVDPVTGEAMVLTGIHAEISFDRGPAANIKTREARPITLSFHNMYRDLITNYDYVNPNGAEVKGSLLVVYPNVSGVYPILEPYIEWKKRRGYHTHAEQVSNGASTTTVKNIIQNAYNTYDPPLEHVVLVGDAAGGLAISCYTYSGGSTDHDYTMVEGSDVITDITVGRLSAGSTNELSVIINKILYYEKNPTLSVTDWYTSAALVSGSSYSGWSTIQINHWIKLKLLELGYTEIDTVWYTMGTSQIRNFMINEMNDGVSLFHFRGWLGMNGLSVSDILNLQNSYKIPFATILTCGTGNFGSSGADESEAFLRAGTVSTPKGAIGCVGSATSGTHTRYNNTMDQGIWYSLLEGGVTEQGPMLFRGKLEIFRTYQYDWSAGSNYVYWNNLMGDPTSDIWVGMPRMITATYPDTVGVGTGYFSVTVRDSAISAPLEGRYVTLLKGGETFVGGPTDENGVFSSEVNLPTSGELLVTVTHHNDYPHLGSAVVHNYPLNPSFHQLSIIDGNTGQTSGNNDQTANPSERIGLQVTLKNYGTSRATTNINAAVSTSDTNVTIVNANAVYPDLNPGQTAVPSSGGFLVQLDSVFLQGYRIPFTIDIATNEGNFVSAFDVEVSSGEAVVTDVSVTGNSFNPGETDNLWIDIENTGQWGLQGAVGALSIEDTMITILDGEANFGSISPGQTINNLSNPFRIASNSFMTHGCNLLFKLHLMSSNGQAQDLYFNLTGGNIGQEDPFGPDDYGYYCVDDADELYSHHPIREWREINASGTRLSLYDTGGDNDQSTLVILPFSFPFYGRTNDTLTVCSNGWMAFGGYDFINDFRNQPIPCVFGPPSGMIIPYWDNLKTSGGSMGVYSQYFPQDHIFVIEYDRVEHTSGGTQTFEVIFYDPAYYTTPTGDGEFVFQYKTFQAVQGPSNDHRYWSTGIMNHEHTTGLQYAHWNNYHPGAAPLASGNPSGRAIKFTTNTPVRGPRPISIDIEPLNPPVVIPRSGGWFRYHGQVTNTGTYLIGFDIWVHATLPNGLQFGPLMVRTGNQLSAGQSAGANVPQYVPPAAPPGNYWINAYVGDYTTREIWATDSLPFTKLGADMSGSNQWRTMGWGGEGSLDFGGNIPMEFTLSPANPNPFNPMTEIAFTLPEPAKVTLEVFNTLGEKVAVLENGWLDAGNYTSVFDGNNLSSGIYFYTLKAGDFVQTRKMMLLR